MRSPPTRPSTRCGRRAVTRRSASTSGRRRRGASRTAGAPAAARSVDRLGRALHALLDDGESFEPPAGLARRTTRLVAESARRRRTILDFVPVVVPFRPADIAVAAGIFLAGLLTLLPA